MSLTIPEKVERWRGPLDVHRHSPVVEQLAATIDARVVGQQQAKKRILRVFERYYAGIRDPRHPVGFFLFLGPSGVGKTQMVRAMAEAWIGDLDGFTCINGAHYNQGWNITDLTGAKKGYVGYNDSPPRLAQPVIDRFDREQKIERVLPERFERLWQEYIDGGWVEEHDTNGSRYLWKEVTKRQGKKRVLTVQTLRPQDIYTDARHRLEYEGHGAPYRSIILFDEIEKAHPEVWNLLLSIEDQARVEISSGLKNVPAETSFSNSIVVLTGNIGSKAIQQFQEGRSIGLVDTSATDVVSRGQRIYEIVKEKARRLLPAELYGRLERSDGMAAFHPLRKGEFHQVLRLQLRDLRRRLLDVCPVLLDITDRAMEQLLHEGADGVFGVRHLEKILYKHVEEPVSRLMNREEVVPGDVVRVDYDRSAGVYRYYCAEHSEDTDDEEPEMISLSRINTDTI